jgi:pyridinium-3,5-bisthiocarboxylic acid mononucleotide nickel chelatase
MRTLYFDCFAGISGDMLLAALIDVGVDEKELIAQLHLLNIEGISIEFERVDRSGISASYAKVSAADEKHHRHLKDIKRIIDASSLKESIKKRALDIFSRLAQAEAHVHNLPVERIHFHEVGALDAIVDVVGACIGFELLGIERFISSPLHVGSGMVEMAHGKFPIPPPAVAELLRGIPIYSSEITGELVTPTGAAIVSTVCSEYAPLPSMRIEKTGYGAGTRDYKSFPNVLRLLLGETGTVSQFSIEKLVMIETNIDDMSPQYLGLLMDRAFQLGALDCYFTPVQMKKNRPGTLVSILCEPALKEALCELLFKETTTLGLRVFEVDRMALDREVISVETKYGKIDIKIARHQGRDLRGMPEYEQCREAALRAGVPLREVEEEVLIEYRKGLGN